MPTIYFPPRPPKITAFPAWIKPHKSWVRHLIEVITAESSLEGYHSYWRVLLHPPLDDGTRYFVDRNGQPWVLCRDSHELSLAHNPK